MTIRPLPFRHLAAASAVALAIAAPASAHPGHGLNVPITAVAMTSTDQLPTGETYQKALHRTPDLDKERTLYVVGYAHLDTQWRWAYPQVIRRVHPEHDARIIRALRQVPRLRVQFQRLAPLRDDEGVLPGRLSSA